MVVLRVLADLLEKGDVQRSSLTQSEVSSYPPIKILTCIRLCYSPFLVVLRVLADLLEKGDVDESEEEDDQHRDAVGAPA